MIKEFAHLKDEVLGKDYELSLVYASSALSRRLNRTYRQIDKPTDILSFPLSKTSGEIFIDRAVARREAPKFGMTYKKFLKYLVIHGLLHLKGMQHGAKMERMEKQLLHVTPNSSRH